MTSSPLTFHPLANLFPLLDGPEFEALVDDVRAFGQREEIVLLGGTILDGRNRYRACLAAGRPVVTVPFDGPRAPLMFRGLDPLAYVLSKNLRRRHLTESQRAMVAADLATLGHGGDRRSDQAATLPLVSQADAAAMVGVSERSVRSAVAVREHGAPELRDAARRGTITVSVAAGVARLDPGAQRRVVARAEEGDANAAKTVLKKEARAERERELARRQIALPTKRYGVILSDPEWRFDPWSRETGMDRAADNHYPTSPTDLIAARDVASIAADDCVLFQWGTEPMLEDALAVIAAWGFHRKSGFVWHKLHPGNGHGTGYWNWNEHEHLFVATRGSIPAPAPGTQWRSVIASPVLGHSEKPDWQYELIEHYFPNLPKIEMNARRRRKNWDCWGLDVEDLDAVA